MPSLSSQLYRAFDHRLGPHAMTAPIIGIPFDRWVELSAEVKNQLGGPPLSFGIRSSENGKHFPDAIAVGPERQPDQKDSHDPCDLIWFYPVI